MDVLALPVPLVGSSLHQIRTLAREFHDSAVVVDSRNCIQSEPDVLPGWPDAP